MANFSDIISGETPVLVDFKADWCGPCKALAPTLVDVKDHYGEKLKIVKIDVDKNQSLAAKYQVRGVPNLILFKNGNIVWRQAGALPKSEFIRNIDPHV